MSFLLRPRFEDMVVRARQRRYTQRSDCFGEVILGEHIKDPPTMHREKRSQLSIAVPKRECDRHSITSQVTLPPDLDLSITFSAQFVCMALEVNYLLI